MIETRRLKNVVIFIQTILNFVLSRKINVIFIFDNVKYMFQAIFKDLSQDHDRVRLFVHPVMNICNDYLT